MFTTRPDHWDRNVSASETITASPALITDAQGGYHHGIAVFTHGGVLTVVTTEAARRLALEIMDALEHHQRHTKVRRPTSTNQQFDQLADR